MLSSGIRLFALTSLLGFSCMPCVAATDVAVAPPAGISCSTCAFEPEAAALEKVLRQYKELAENGGWPAWKPGKAIKPGHADARIPTLRQFLTITGDYRSVGENLASSTHYDAPLQTAIKRFQTRHGLNPNGMINTATQAALAVPVEKRIAQIMATIDRIRSRPQEREAKFVLVNLPAFSLYAIEQGKSPLFMRVIVGNRRNHTPLFDNTITDVIFNPQWHVPQRIAKNELIPKLRENPSYFIRAGFVVTQDGQPIDPTQASPTDDDFSFRQLAGRSNALGKIKFNIPDSDDIYLHSTSSPGLFAKDDRALSHGCIRVERPRELAHFVMDGASDWNGERIDSAYDADRERWVKIDSVPVHLVYWTAFVDAAGVPYFYNDIYGKDAAMTASIQQTLTLAQK